MPTNMAPLLEFLGKQSIWEKEVSVINRLCKNQQTLKELKKENKEKDKKIKELSDKVEELEFSNTYLSNTAKDLEEKRKYYREDREKKLKAICKVMKLEVWCSPKYLLDKDIHEKYEFITDAIDKVFYRMYEDHLYYVDRSDSMFLCDTPNFCENILGQDRSERIRIPQSCSDFKLDHRVIVALRIWINRQSRTDWTFTKDDLEDEYKNDFNKMYEENPLSILETVSHTPITMLMELWDSLDDANGYMTELRTECIENEYNEGEIYSKYDYNELKEEKEELENELEEWKDLGLWFENNSEILPLTGVAIPDTMYGSDPEEIKECVKFMGEVWRKRLETSKFAYDSLKDELSGKEEFDMMNVVEDIQKKGEDLIDKNIELVEKIKDERKDYNRLMIDVQFLAPKHYSRVNCASSVFHKIQLNPSWIKKALKANGVIPTKDGAYPRAYLSMEFIKKVEYKIVRLLTDHMEIINLQHPQNPKKFYHVKENSVMDNVEKLMKYEVKDIHKFDNDSFLDYGAQMETEEQKRIKELRIRGFDAGQLVMRRGTSEGEIKYYKKKDIDAKDFQFY